MRVVELGLGLAAACAALAAVEPGRTAASTGATDYAHQTLTVREGRPWLESDGELRPIEDVAAFCLDCHGQAAAADKSHALGPEESSHPTGIAYPAKHSEYRAIEELDPGILLSDGRVTCLSCHAYDAPDHRPVLAVQGGHLCQACHLL